MKTAISIPDSLNQNIENFLQVANMSRSEFFQQAARLYLDKVSAQAITDNLNSVYSEVDNDSDSTFRKAALQHFRGLSG